MFISNINSFDGADRDTNPILDKKISVRLSIRPDFSVLLHHAQGTPLDYETDLTRELWLKTNLLNWQN